jgi:hypothetical protein
MQRITGRKLPIRLLAVNGLLALLLAGCGPIVRSAPFAQRPDSVKRGSALGPFEGRVVDTDTRAPVSEALVWCGWSFSRGIGNQAPERVETTTTRTNADGAYQVRALRRFPQGLSTHLSKFTMVIYKKGYVAYRHDRIFNHRRRRRTFSQYANEVRLSRWSPELSHMRHLLFIGSAPALAKASAWEVPEAVAELEGRSTKRSFASRLTAVVATPQIKVKRRLDASVLLSSDEVRAVTGYTGGFKTGRLAGASTDEYDTYHLRAADRPERYDVAIRLWRLEGDEATKKYEELLNTLPGSKQNDKIADRSFSVTQGEILGFGLLERATGIVVLLTCGKGQCTREAHLQALAKTIAGRLDKLGEEPAPAPAKPLAPLGGGAEGAP